MNRIKLLSLSLISSILLIISWIEQGFPFLLLIAYIPLLIIENEQYKLKKNSNSFLIFTYSFISFSLFLIFTIGWLYHAAFIAAFAAIFINASLMSLVFWLFHCIRINSVNNNAGYISLIFMWLSVEFLQYHWDLNFPWLNIGNGFATYNKFIQWYEFTGTLGGSLWVLISNVFIFKLIIYYIDNKRIINKKLLFSSIFILFVPIIISLYIYYSYKEIQRPIHVVVVQPNLDPYTEQYEKLSENVIIDALKLSFNVADSLTNFIVFPESMVQPDFSSNYRIWENNIEESEPIIQFRDSIKNQNTALIVGFSTYRHYNKNEQSATARCNGDFCYDCYNTAVYLKNDKPLQYVHKSKLTPGVEMMPFPWLLKPLESLMLDFGGTIGQLGVDNKRIPFVDSATKAIIAPIICYESVFGEYVSEFVRNDANVIFVITNDGWWNNSNGHKQHNRFSALRAIETRRAVARSANTGISCFINQRGDIIQSTKYDEEIAIKQSINLNNVKTFYVKHGDFIGRAAAFGVLLLLLIYIVQKILNKIAKH